MPPLKAISVEAKIERQTIHAWLLSLAKAGIVAPNVRVTLEVEKLLGVLLEERKEKDPAAYAFALAGLLAKDEAAHQRVIEHFQAFFEVKFDLPWKPGREDEPKSKPSRRRNRMLIGLGVLLSLGIVAAIGFMIRPEAPKLEDGGFIDPGPPPMEQSDYGTLEAGILDAAGTVEAELELIQAPQTHILVSNLPSPPRFDWLHRIAAFFSLVLGLIAIRALFAHQAFQAEIEQSKRRAEEKRLAAKSGDVKKEGVLYRFDARPLLAQSDMDDSASMLGRLTLAEPGIELNVTETLAQTIHEGGRIRPIFAVGRRPDPLVVLLDTEQGGHPFLKDMESLLRRWQEAGVRLARYDFSFRPTVFRRYGDGRLISLNDLAHRYEGARVLLISRMVFPEDARMQVHWLKERAFQCWSQRAFLDLDPRPKKHRPSDERATLGSIEHYWTRFPCTREGLLACASWLLSRGQKSQKPKEPDLLSLKGASMALKEALETWAAAASCVPDPEWGHLDSIREALPELREQLPDARYVQLLLQWLGEQEGYIQDISGTGIKLRLRTEAKQKLIVALRKRDRSGIEYRVRELLIEQMKRANVQEKDNAYLYERQRMKMAVHEAILGKRTVRELIEAYKESPTAGELFRLLEEEAARQEKKGLLVGRETVWMPAEHGEVMAWTRGRRGVRARDLFRVGAWDRRQGVAAGMGLVVLLGVWGGWGMGWGMQREPRIAVRTGETWKVKEKRTDALADVAPMRFVKLPGGKFMMGSPHTEANRCDDEKQHPAEVSAFEIGMYEVTQKQWTTVMGTKPFNCDYGCGDDYPAQNISWNNAVQFMNKLTEIENKTRPNHKQWRPCYEKQDEKWIWNKTCNGYRLPTEAEWEYAARAGTKTAYSFGDDQKELCKHGNGASTACDDGYENLAPVGKFKANPWGLYDMHGNVWEWIWDLYAPYPENAKANYGGPVTSADSDRVFRGGSFSLGPGWLRSSLRYRLGPSIEDWYYGFRCVRSAPRIPRP